MKNRQIMSPLTLKINALLEQKAEILYQIYKNKKLSKRLDYQYQKMDEINKQYNKHGIGVMKERLINLNNNLLAEAEKINKKIDLIRLYKL